MWPALLALLLVFLFPLFVSFIASGFLLFAKPQGLRPAWWDWGMDEPEPVAKAEIAPIEPIARVEAELPPRVVAPERVKRAAGPRW